MAAPPDEERSGYGSQAGSRALLPDGSGSVVDSVVGESPARVVAAVGWPLDDLGFLAALLPAYFLAVA